MLKEFEVLKDTILKYSNRQPIYYLPNPGNWGDALIRYATLQFFEDSKIKYTELKLTKKSDWLKPFFKRGVLIYGGGGAWCNNWDHAYKILKKKYFLFKSIVVLPSTYQSHYFLPKTYFFRRDKFESEGAMPNSIFCHDMAFYLKDKLINQGTAFHKVGNFFRVDHESARTKLPENNIDITHDKNTFSPIEPFIQLISGYKTINTDKLHVAILGSLLNKKVHFHSGNYFKNKAIYKSSIEYNFTNTNFID